MDLDEQRVPTRHKCECACQGADESRKDCRAGYREKRL